MALILDQKVAGRLPLERTWDAIQAGEPPIEAPAPWMLWAAGGIVVALGIIGLVRMRKEK